jgi:hypothetical protein
MDVKEERFRLYFPQTAGWGMKEEGGFCDRNSSNFLNAIKGIKAIALNLVAVFHRKRGVFHRKGQVFHNRSSGCRRFLSFYLYKFQVF